MDHPAGEPFLVQCLALLGGSHNLFGERLCCLNLLADNDCSEWTAIHGADLISKVCQRAVEAESGSQMRIAAQNPQRQPTWIRCVWRQPHVHALNGRLKRG